MIQWKHILGSDTLSELDMKGVCEAGAGNIGECFDVNRQ